MPHGTSHRRKGPGRFERESVSLVELTKMFPTERAARLWLEKSVWPDGPVCPYCGSAGRAAPKPNGSRTHCCSDRNCNRWFSVNSVIARASRNVTRWRDGSMALRWNAAGMLMAQQGFRRVNGHMHLPKLAVGPESDARVA